jgi:hypothetical protein
MGREAECACDWNGAKTKVKALIEPPELILRGELRRRIPFSAMQRVRADNDNLRFNFGGDQVSLLLGSALAIKWVEYLTAPPPSLAKKLGITADTIVRLIGEADDESIVEALASAKSTVTRGTGNLIVARVDTPEDLHRALKSAADQLTCGVPIWFIYPKGKGQVLTENGVRSTALATGIVDTKVAAVSSKLTALRFVKRRKP